MNNNNNVNPNTEAPKAEDPKKPETAAAPAQVAEAPKTGWWSRNWKKVAWVTGGVAAVGAGIAGALWLGRDKVTAAAATATDTATDVTQTIGDVQDATANLI